MYEQTQREFNEVLEKLQAGYKIRQAVVHKDHSAKGTSTLFLDGQEDVPVNNELVELLVNRGIITSIEYTQTFPEAHVLQINQIYQLVEPNV